MSGVMVVESTAVSTPRFLQPDVFTLLPNPRISIPIARITGGHVFLLRATLEDKYSYCEELWRTRIPIARNPGG